MVGVGPSGISWAVLVEGDSAPPNLFAESGTIDMWMGFHIPWDNVRHTSHEDGVFHCTYRAIVTKPKLAVEEHVLRAQFGDTPDDARQLALLVTQLREESGE
jgi:hypothetical protein